MSTSLQTIPDKRAPLTDVDNAIIDEEDYEEDDTEYVHLSNENMEAHIGKWLNEHYNSKKSNDNNGKGKGKGPTST